jgi:hypothetical protein
MPTRLGFRQARIASMQKDQLASQDRPDGVRSSAPTWVLRVTPAFSRPDARIDLLFTMSDNCVRPGFRRWRTRIHFTDECPDWWSQTGSNRRPPACKAGALPAELWPRCRRPAFAEATAATFVLRRRRPNLRRLVGLDRLERSTSPLSGVRSNHLSYRPVKHTP